MGPLEHEVRERLSKSPFHTELGDEIRAATGAGDGGTPREIDLAALLAGLLNWMGELDEVAIRLAAEIDRLRGQDAPS